MASFPILPGTLLYMISIVIMWLAIFMLRDIFKQVSESIDSSFNWRLIYIVLALLAIPFLLTVYFFAFNATSLFGQPVYLLRAIPLLAAAAFLFAVTYRLKEVSLFRHTPISMKAIFLCELALGGFLSASAAGPKYILTNFMVVLAALFLGISLSNIAVFAKQFDRVSKVHVILFITAIVTPLFGTLRAYFFSTFSPYDPIQVPPLVDLTPGALLFIQALITLYAIRNFTKVIDDLDSRLKTHAPYPRQLSAQNQPTWQKPLAPENPQAVQKTQRPQSKPASKKNKTRKRQKH